MTRFDQSFPLPLTHEFAAAPVQGEDAASPGMLEVTVDSAADLDDVLENAIKLIAKSAEHHQVGIMVTRTGLGRYVVRAHPAVPYGLIRQRNA